jgi:hypothetical protein
LDIKHIKVPSKASPDKWQIRKMVWFIRKTQVQIRIFDKSMNWYNTVRFHESLDTKHYL